MTRQDLMQKEGDFLSANDVAEYMHFAPQQFRVQCREDPSKLGFPVCCCGSRILIPKWPFLRFVGGPPHYQILPDGRVEPVPEQ